MSPTLVLHNGSPILSFGSPGGSRIIGLVVNVAVNYLDFGMSLRDAVDAPRVISRNGIADVEHSLYIQPELHAALIAAGFNITDNWGSRPYGYVQSLAMSPNASSPTGRTIVAVADNKRQATAAAFAY